MFELLQVHVLAAADRASAEHAQDVSIFDTAIDVLNLQADAPASTGRDAAAAAQEASIASEAGSSAGASHGVAQAEAPAAATAAAEPERQANHAALASSSPKDLNVAESPSPCDEAAQTAATAAATEAAKRIRSLLALFPENPACQSGPLLRSPDGNQQAGSAGRNESAPATQVIRVQCQC